MLLVADIGCKTLAKHLITPALLGITPDHL
jgi:hypothetical protein